MHNKNIIHKNDPIIDHKIYISNDLKNRDDKIHLYVFDDKKRYFGINNFNESNKMIIEQVKNPLKISLLWASYGKKKNKDKMKKFLLKLSNDKEINNHEINQSGGFLIWLFQKGIENIFPDWFTFLFDIVLDIIDIALVVAITIPGSSPFVGDNFILTATSIVFSILRFDIIGAISGIIRFIPTVGKILGGIIFMGGKIGKYALKSMNYWL